MITHSAASPRWSAQVAEARAAYGSGALEAGSIVVLLLDDERRPTGRTLIRAADPALGSRARSLLLREAMHVLRHGHVSGEAASQCLLLAFPGPGPLTAHRLVWWSALREACASVDLLPLGVVTVDHCEDSRPPTTSGDLTVTESGTAARTIDIQAIRAHHPSHATA